eukprot:1570077-Pyramimonas_sp.AAC.1
MQAARRRRNHERQANGMLRRTRQPDTPTTAGTPAYNPAVLSAMQPPSVHRFSMILVKLLWSARRVSGHRQRR